MSRPINHVFYTDDDEDDHLIFQEALKEAKPVATLHPFYNCKDIIDYLKDETKLFPDIIFLDQNMHGNRDNECLKEIKQIAKLQNIPVIMYTTGAHPHLVGNALELGAYKYVIKPNFLADTIKNLSEVLTECEKS